MTTKHFILTLTGKGGHGAIPAVTVDPVVAVSAVVRDLQILAQRNGNARVRFTRMDSGTKFNVIPNTAVITGEISYGSEQVFQALKTALAHTAAAYRTTLDLCLE